MENRIENEQIPIFSTPAQHLSTPSAAHRVGILITKPQVDHIYDVTTLLSCLKLDTFSGTDLDPLTPSSVDECCE